MDDRADVLPRFLKDTADHQMEVVRDDGLHRHLKFRKPGTSCYGFDIVSWPGHLAISGDMGAAVFTRLQDMIEFFRTPDRQHEEAGGLYINSGYWAEKCVANNGDTKEYRAELFRALVKRHFDEFVADRTNDESGATHPAWAPLLWQELEDEVLFDAEDADALSSAIQKMDRFKSEHSACKRFRFTDAWESASSLRTYTFSFLWRLYAISYAVRAYDAMRAKRAPDPVLEVDIP